MKRRDEVLVGVFLTASVIIGLLGTLWLVRGGLSSGYPLHARFAWGQNLKPGQPVLLAGVNVGGVRAVKLRDDGYLARFGGAPRLSQGRSTWKRSAPITSPWVITGVAAGT